MPSVNDVVARIRPRVRDNSSQTFTDSVLREGVYYGLRATYPGYSTTHYHYLGTVASGEESVDVTPYLAVYGSHGDGVSVSLCGVQYKAGGRWIGLSGWNYDEDSGLVEFGKELSRDREVRLVECAALVPENDVDDWTAPQWLQDAIEAYAIAWVLEGYLVGRIPFDKYTTVTSDDAVSPYDVESAARRFRLIAEDLMTKHGRSRPALNVR